MVNEKISFEQTNQFGKLFLDYIGNQPKLEPFFSLYPCIENFEEQIKRKSNFSEKQRIILNEVLNEQYQGLENSPQSNIDALLDAKTFTVTTGHQLNIFTGPLYFIYKIVTVLNLAKELKAKYPNYNFVPVYWMATEDHDFEEISYFRLFGKKHTWQHPNPKGAVGRLSCEGLERILEEIPEIPEIFRKAYTESETLTEATRSFVNALFGKDGLVILDADHPKLKAILSDVIKDDLIKHSTKKLVNETDQKLENLHYTTQIFARDSNFFYLEGNIRERIEKQGDKYQVLNTEISFTEKELLSLIEKSPEKFSPNVVLRPLYEERILPNLAYIGGPAEVVYWLQLKEMFAYYHTEFPMLIPRNFALVVPKSINKKMGKLQLSNTAIFKETHQLKNQFLHNNSENDLTLTEEKIALEIVFASIIAKAEQVDKSLEGFIGAEKTKALKSLNNIEK